MTEIMRRLAEGDTKVVVPAEDRGDEIGAMAKAIHVFRDAAVEKARLEGEAVEQRARLDAERMKREEQQKAVERERAHVTDAIGLALSKLAGKQLSYRIAEDFPAAFADIKANFNGAMAEIDTALSCVCGIIASVQTQSHEILIASDDLAQRTERQSIILEELGKAMRELASVITRTAESSISTKDIITSTKTDTIDSIGTVQRAIDAIEKIKASSETISGIVGLIDEVSFQTNLLALNAGVEAARAGEFGRGFAVVASEVRALAQRSAEAAREIKDNIARSTVQVANGVELVNATGRAFDRIKNEISIIDGGIATIAGQAIDQSQTLKQVNIAIGEIDQTTQKNAAMAEEATAACRNLAAEGTRLAEMMRAFVLSAETVSADEPPRAAARRAAA